MPDAIALCLIDLIAISVVREAVANGRDTATIKEVSHSTGETKGPTWSRLKRLRAASLIPDPGKDNKEPWKAAGVSIATWYRHRATERQKAQTNRLRKVPA